MKKRLMAVLFAVTMMSTFTAFAAEPETEPVSEASGTAASEEQSGSETLSEDWTDFEIQIDGTVYRFPMTFEELTALGWSSSDDLTLEMEPYEYTWFSFANGEKECSVYFLNLSINNLPAQDCIVAGIQIDDFDWEPELGEVVLPGGITRNVSTGEEIEAAYGTPSDLYEGELYTLYTYQIDYNQEYELTVDKESGLLNDIDVRNFTEPEDFEIGEVSSEVPESIIAYQKPEALSEDLTAYEIQVGEEVYALPVPVSTLLADGWEIVSSGTSEFIAANSSGWVELRNGGQSFRTLARNEEGSAVLPENSWIEEIEVGGYELEMDGALPGGVRIGMTEDEFVQILEDAGMEYTVEESGSFKYYTYNEKAYDQCLEVLVYTADDGEVPQNTVFGVTCSYAFD